MVRELRIALSISLGTVTVGGCLSSLDERDLEDRANGGTAGMTSGGTGGTAGSAGGASGAGGNAGGTGGVSKGGSAGTNAEAGRGGRGGDGTSSTAGMSGNAGVTNASGAAGDDGGSDDGGHGGNDTSAGGSENGTGGDGGTAGSTGGSSGTAGSAGLAGDGGAGTTTLPPIEAGDLGFATRYWDCCKPTCAWSANVPDGTPAQSCGANDEGVTESSQNACAGGTAYACHSLAPWAANDQLAYGYVASSTDCGRCYELQFTGAGHFNQSDAGSSAVRDRHMFVQVIQRSDVPAGQFDLLIPGGGVGQFSACSTQWRVNASELGAQYGGFASNCTSGDLATRKSCVRETCADVFADLPELRAGCDWFIDWLSLADNPDLVFREIDCPAELQDRSGLDGGL